MFVFRVVSFCHGSSPADRKSRVCARQECLDFARTLPPVIPITCLSRLFLCFIESWCVTSWQFYNRLQSTLHRPKQLLLTKIFLFFTTSRSTLVPTQPDQTMKAQQGNEGIVLLFLYPRRHAPPALCAGKRSGTRCTGGWVEPRTVLDGCKKNPASLEFDFRTVHPAPRRYTDWATPVRHAAFFSMDTVLLFWG